MQYVQKLIMFSESRTLHIPTAKGMLEGKGSSLDVSLGQLWLVGCCLFSAQINSNFSLCSKSYMSAWCHWYTIPFQNWWHILYCLMGGSRKTLFFWKMVSPCSLVRSYLPGLLEGMNVDKFQVSNVDNSTSFLISSHMHWQLLFLWNYKEETFTNLWHWEHFLSSTLAFFALSLKIPHSKSALNVHIAGNY